jgi:hypothetical protein
MGRGVFTAGDDIWDRMNGVIREYKAWLSKEQGTRPLTADERNFLEIVPGSGITKKYANYLSKVVQGRETPTDAAAALPGKRAGNVDLLMRFLGDRGVSRDQIGGLVYDEQIGKKWKEAAKIAGALGAAMGGTALLAGGLAGAGGAGAGTAGAAGTGATGAGAAAAAPNLSSWWIGPAAAGGAGGAAPAAAAGGAAGGLKGLLGAAGAGGATMGTGGAGGAAAGIAPGEWDWMRVLGGLGGGGSGGFVPGTSAGMDWANFVLPGLLGAAGQPGAGAFAGNLMGFLSQQAAMRQAQQAQDRANRENEARYGEMRGLANQQLNATGEQLAQQRRQMIGAVGQAGNSARRAIMANQTAQMGAATLDAQRRGLGGTSVLPNMRRAIGADTNRSLADLSERIGTARAGVLGDNSLANFMLNRTGIETGMIERRNDQASLGPLYQMLSRSR